MPKDKRYATYEEAEVDQVLCEICGKPTTSLFASHKWDRESYYFRDRCDLEGCRLHCQCPQGDIKLV